MRLLFIGKDISRRNLLKFLDGLRAKYPNASETAIQEIAKTELAKDPPRHSRFVQALFGRDVLAEDPTTIEAWRWLTPYHQRLVLHPEREGRTRESLIDPAGLSKTYVWRAENDWLQEVADEDVAIIRQSEARTWFRDFDRYGEFTPARSWDFPVVETAVFRDVAEAKRYERDQKRTQQWKGV